MELYTETSYQLARHLTKQYSTSFGKSTELFDTTIRPHIFAIYGLVRVADEIVDTYLGKDARKQLDELEVATYEALQTGFSANPIIHAFSVTAREFSITKALIKPFFASMRMDLTPRTYSQKEYAAYIYGSAEVIGLMCLKVFCGGDTKAYEKLAPGAQSLGAAYQKVNFLRDIGADYQERQRVYFPGVTFDDFSEKDKTAIIKDISRDFKKAKASVDALPPSANKAVALSYAYYSELLARISETPASSLKTTRVSVPAAKKLRLLVASRFRKSA